MGGNRFWPWVAPIAALMAEGKARGWMTRAEILAALSKPRAPEGLVGEFTVALKAKGIRVLDQAPVAGVVPEGVTEPVQRLIARGKARGYVTLAELNAALPSGQVSAEVIEDHLAMLSELGINVVDAAEGETEG